MRRRSPGWLLLAALVAPPLGAQGRDDSGFAALQRRGAQVMGVDQYTSEHRFDDLADGGRIVLVRDARDSAGVRVIRRHLEDIARAFRAGDFAHTSLVHGRELPGLAVMRQRRAAIRYDVDSLPGGGAVRLVSRDAVAVRAIHAFLAAQRHDHRAGGAVADSSASHRH